jgi:hypothetical protein
MKKIFTLVLFALTTLFCDFANAQTDPNAKINLAMVGPVNPIPATVGETFVVELMMNAATTNQRYLVADIVFGWNPKHLELVGVNHEGSHPMIWDAVSGLPTGQGGDYVGVNEVMPPADGNGLYYGYGELGQQLIVTTQPVKIVNFIFETGCANKFYSELYAKLYKELIEKYPVFKEVIMPFIEKYVESIQDVKVVDQNKDYDGFCENNKKNEEANNENHILSVKT